jgi:hypothetical protein
MIDVGEIGEISERKIMKVSDLVDNKKIFRNDISSNSLKENNFSRTDHFKTIDASI